MSKLQTYGLLAFGAFVLYQVVKGEVKKDDGGCGCG
jgi:hypothetical protein